MKKGEFKSFAVEDSSRNLLSLACDLSGGIDYSSPDEAWVASPIQCLYKAFEHKPKIIVISFIRTSIQERETLVELSAALKRNSHTNQSIVLALLVTKHRKLAKDLKRAKVDYVRCIGDAKLDSNLVREIIHDLGPADSLDRVLETLCPFLNYSKIDSQREMMVCGAYLDRMVLGGRRLHELCETEDHPYCEYYQHPRRKL
ncbi:hypothetical protein DSCW_36190 [Desulfosarcina widdelii]|uniref:Uncharacterized protein n=1 Tax=Desulfosarcina widdelii TaxID=947919 RepID=A0A5K7Z2G2_9BACT|nr:hypothetical protein [Desulfosarcina widdelii]BBO76202.1 hypothetical protein DSCW_36190 [Desulfosarcina widdelii]